jgi:O-antigen/teichoic acid export membrane protein
MSKGRELVKNILILALGKGSTQLLSFLLLPVYTAFLSPSDYGSVDLTITYLTLLLPIITIQLEMASFRFLVDARDDEARKKQIISSTLRTISIILTVCVAAFLLLNTFVQIPYAGLILVNACAMVFSNLFLQFARGVGENKKYTVACIATGVATILATILFVIYAHMGAEGMLLAIALANIVCGLYLFFSLKIYNYINSRRHKSLRKKMIKYSFPLVPGGVSWWVMDVSDRTIISVFLGVAANGVYAISNKYAAIFTSIFFIFFMSWTESASVHINDTDRDKFFSQTSNATIRLFGSLGAMLIASIPFLFPLLIDERYSQAFLYIPLLVVAACFNALGGLHGAIYIAKRKTQQIAKTTVAAAVVNIILNLVLIKFLGLYAAAISTMISYMTMAIYRHYDVKKYVNIQYENNIFVKLTALYAFVVVLYYCNNIIGNIVNVTVVVVVAILLNKSFIKVIKDKVFSLAGRKPKQLTSEQEIYEDSV